MKKPEDKLEKLYQEKLGGQESPVNERVWERVKDRTGGERKKKGFFWWFFGIFLLLGIGAFSSIYLMEDEESSGSENTAAMKQEKGGKKESEGSGPSKETETSSSRPSKEADSEGNKEKPDEESAPMEDKKKNGQRERPEKGSSDKKEKGPTTDPQEGARKKGEKSDPEGSSPEERVKKERPTKEREAGSSGKKEEGIPDAKEEKGKNRTATANKGPGEKNKERTDDKGTASSSSSKSEKNPIEKPGKREKDNAAPDQKEPLPLLERSFQAPSLTDTGGLNPIGKQPGLIEFPKGKEGIYVRSIVSYGPRYRSLKPEGDRGLVEHRNQNESPSDGFHYGIESGFRWRNGLAAGLGLERTSYGSEFSFNDSETLRDSTFSTDTNYIYLDSTYIDPNTGDTITVIVDSIPDSVQNDTTVTQRDSSYEHQYQIRYRYITVPLHLSYRFELSDRFTVVPTLGLGLNFLTRASTGWTRAESHEKVRHRYPSKDPPFKRFALSFRGRVALRYGLADRWEIGAGIRYSRFLQNIYDEDMGMRELPYSYGGSFSVTYLLDLGE